MSKTRHKIFLSLLVLIFALSAIACTLFIAGTGTAHAAGNTGVHTLYGTESITHEATSALFGTDFTESAYRNTGIQIYSSANNGTSTSGNSVKIDTNTFYIDFSGASPLYYAPSDRTVMGYYDKSYNFEILNSSGRVVWYARMTGTSTTSGETTTYKKVVNVNGSSKTTTGDVTIARFNPSEFGRRSVSLSSGNYTIRISRTYYWTQLGGGIMIMGIYNSASSMSGTLLVDYTSPTLSAKGYSTGKTIANGSYINERVTLTGSDTNFSRLYYRTPTNSGYTYTSAKTYTTGTTNGWYYAYAQDTVGNKSSTYSFYYDSVKPTGKISSNGTSVTSGTYISKSFSYSATDSGSGVATCYYKTPTSGSYQVYTQGTIIPANAGDGWYYFYSVDRSGNQSSTVSVYLETQAPLVEIYRNGELAYSKSMTASGSYDTGIYLRPNDTLKISCDTSSGKVTSNYSLDTNIIIGSNYPNDTYTITLTSATGIKSNFTYHIVRENPTFTINRTTYHDGDTLYYNTDTAVSWHCSDTISDTADTGISIVSEGDVNLDEFVKYTDGKTRTLTTAAGTETKYILTQTDRAGNTSTLTVVIDKAAPTGAWRVNGSEFDDGGYTNKPLTFEFDDDNVSATYSFNGGEYKQYTSGTEFTADGAYTVVLTDPAGNKTSYTAYIDTAAPEGQLYADYSPVASGFITNGKVYFSWEGEASATVNGTPYTKNSVVSGDAAYTFVLTDLAGNSSTYKITIDTVPPSYNADKLNGSSQMISRWYVVSLDGEKHSFATYDEALAFASGKEYAAFVTVLNLDNVEDFNQHHLVADNGSAENTDDEVRTGEYWLYKSKANPESLLYYFDRNLLNEVIAHYAKEYVSPVNYFVQDGSNEYGTPAESMNDNLLTAPDGTAAPALNGFVFDKTDGTKLYAELVGGNGEKTELAYGIPFDEQIVTGGLYKLTETDDAGNETVFYGFLDVLAPELNVTATIYGNDEATELTITKDSLSGIAAYYYESFKADAIADADKWSVLSVQNSGKTSFYTCGDELPALNAGGEYLLTVYDRNGNYYSFTVYIVGNEADISFRNNSDDTAFDLKITLEQNFDTLVSLEIRYNGELLEGVSTDTLSYTFDKAGVYTVTLRDNFGRVIEREYTFVKASPVGKLDGVENGGKTKNDVTFTYDSGKYYVVVTKDGAAVETDGGGEIIFTANDVNSGAYVIRLIRLTDEENFTEYSFAINTLAPVFEMSVADGATTNKDVTVSWSAEDIVNITFSLNGGEPVQLENGQALSAEGNYVIAATNDLGTVSEMTFTIDKTLDYYVTFGGEVSTADTTGDAVAVFSNENLYVSATKNGEPMDYAFGDILSEEAVYIFRITDDYGNSTTFTVTIDKSVSFSANIGNGLISNGGVVFENDEKLTVLVTKDNQVVAYEFGQTLNAEGSYKVILRDGYGNEQTIEFLIVSGIKKSLDYTLGENVEILSVKRDGESIEAENNRLNFTEDGTYIVTARADGKEYEFALLLDATPPTIVIDGVENGGVADAVVTLSEPSEQATVEVYFNGELIPYELGQELSEYGEYRVVVTDQAGNVSEYSFTLEHILNGGAIALIVIVILVVIGVIVAVVIMRKKGKFGKNKSEKDTEKND